MLGSKLVNSAKDVRDELNMTSAPGFRIASRAPTLLVQPDKTNARALLQAMGYDAVGLDALQARSGLPTQNLLAQLLTLELQGLVARRAGGLFQRMAMA